MNLSEKELVRFAKEIRLETVKQLVNRTFGHFGGSMSCVELVAVLYGCVLNVDPSCPEKEDRDILIVSKGHAGPTIYSALALRGFFPKDWLLTLNEGGTKLPSHMDHSKTPGVDFTTGSLGQGLSVAVGVAYGFALDKKNRNVYVLLGDGEIQEGQIWEAAMAGAKYKLNRLYAFIDANKYELDGSTDDIMPLGDIAAKFRSFGWFAQEIDGHDVASISAAIRIAQASEGKPCMIILNTVKGHGVKEISDMKNHSHHMHITPELGEHSIRVLEEALADC
jgi:transketolase